MSFFGYHFVLLVSSQTGIYNYSTTHEAESALHFRPLVHFAPLSHGKLLYLAICSILVPILV